MEKEKVSIEFIEGEIKTLNEQIATEEANIKKLNRGLEDANNNRNAAYGALQQCLKIREMLVPAKAPEAGKPPEKDGNSE